MTPLSEPDAQLFRELEERLFQPEVRHNRQEVERLLADRFVEIGSSGTVSTRHDIINWMQTEPAMQRTLSDFRTVRLAPTLVLVTYRSTRQDASGHDMRHSLRSSIWKQTDGEWQMLFHQGTPTEVV
jgi:glyoxylase I family protein